ncbi:MAG: hypothetical protein JRI77_09525, partial [Deltaproteobacteria bacterium]|nr:hypothetical protein [Deltaproteobacteria bacterium]
MTRQQEIRFVAESALGKLAKWLRILGFDTIYEPEFSDRSFRDPGRIRLTRTLKTYRQLGGKSIIFITSDHYPEQIKQVIRELGITLQDVKPFSR